MNEYQSKCKDKAFLNYFPAEYKLDERINMYVEVEDKIPPETLFMAIGHDKTHESGVKHYRKIYNEELENIPRIMGNPNEKPFSCLPISIGQSQQSTSREQSFLQMNKF